MFYEIEITVWHGCESYSQSSTWYRKRNKLLFKNELIQEAKQETDSKIINALNFWYKDCQFDFIKAYHKHGITFYAEATIKNRITGKSSRVYYVEWIKDYWNLKLVHRVDEKLKLT